MKVTGQKNIHHLEIIKINILSKIHDDHFKNVTLEHQQGFPLIWPDIKWPSFKLDLEIIKTNILSNIYDDYLKTMTSGVLTVFCWFGPGDLVFDPMWPCFELNLEIIKTNILSKIHDDCFKNVTTRVLTKFSADLAWWSSFWPQVTQFRTWPRTHQEKHFE